MIGKVPARAASFAARELQWHVKEITGATLPIVRDTEAVAGTRILVGESEAARALGVTLDGFKRQEYLIRFAPEALATPTCDAPKSRPISPRGQSGSPR